LTKTLKLFGPPGTGKTHALLELFEAELRTVPPERIAFLTFTVQARREAMSRAMEKFNFGEERLPYVRTLHSVAYRALAKTKAGMIAQASDMRPFGDRMGLTFKSGPMDDDAAYQLFGYDEGDRMLAFDHFRRHNMATVEEAYRVWPGNANLYSLRRFSTSYKKWKEAEGLHDFTDLLFEADVTLPVDVVFVDEAQDLSKLQWRALDRFARGAERVYIAGDDDQAIFEWAGASPSAFVARPGEVKVLDQSYRIPARVHGVAGSLIRPVRGRQQKVYKPRAVEGAVRYVREIDSVDLGGEGSRLVLARTHASLKRAEAHARQLGVPYSKADRPAPGAEFGRAIVLWERLRRGNRIPVEECREVYDAMSSGGRSLARGAKATLRSDGQEGDGALGIDDLRSHHGLRTDQPWYDALDRISDDESQYLRNVLRRSGARALVEPPKVRLSTIHAAKGAEADHVTLMTDLSPGVRREMDRNADPERRVFYVGVTRARESLTLVGFDNPLF
jgi:DNA helicase-2/ATP-dependent DNA helicase PcrA